ncbi:nucleotide exchange factor GrpE [Sulfobacillus harzensis]|uniref:Protein GrpE n=1 Tax=Sulfobacillus harzensis TaxID=2729629 RepID=A0A7Y0L474_9FIRM|nr:nucleotide exchange factor GrpE [Sulfobacillus harzensis]
MGEEEQKKTQDSPGGTDQAIDEEQEAPSSPDGGSASSDETATDWEEVARSRYDQLIRLQADFENFRRRMDRERDEIQGRVAERLLTDLLPVFDNLERAVKFMPSEGEAKVWRVGVEMTLNGFMEALARLGVKPIEALGAPFDPRYHEAVQRVDSADPEGTVVEELQRGFVWNDRVLRASMVKVSTGQAPSAEPVADGEE